VKQSQKPIVERAYELARTGKFIGVGEIKSQLKAEKYAASEIDAHLRGTTIRKHLDAICAESR